MNKNLYLWSGDYKSFEIIRQIQEYDWIRLENQDCLVVTADIPVHLEKNGIQGEAVNTFYLLPRFGEQMAAFKNFSSFPIYVHVLVPKSENLNNADDFTNLAWATLYNNRKDAERDCGEFAQTQKA